MHRQRKYRKLTNHQTVYTPTRNPSSKKGVPPTTDTNKLLDVTWGPPTTNLFSEFHGCYVGETRMFCQKGGEESTEARKCKICKSPKSSSGIRNTHPRKAPHCLRARARGKNCSYRYLRETAATQCWRIGYDGCIWLYPNSQPATTDTPYTIHRADLPEKPPDAKVSQARVCCCVNVCAWFVFQAREVQGLRSEPDPIKGYGYATGGPANHQKRHNHTKRSTRSSSQKLTIGMEQPIKEQIAAALPEKPQDKRRFWRACEWLCAHGTRNRS